MFREGAAVAGWRDDVLRAFTPGVARLPVAADPDGLLLEAGILAALRSRGFEVTAFEDPAGAASSGTLGTAENRCGSSNPALLRT